MGKITHGYTGTPTHDSWRSMKSRCNNPQVINYSYYGGKGITYDPRWEQFEEFLKDMGERPKGMTLDRFPDPNGNYFKENCRWASKSSQTRNSKSFTGKSPIPGVYWHKPGEYWVSYSSQFEHRRIKLYQGKSLFEAVCRRKSYELSLVE